jgi:hypothetical protein
MRKFIPIGAAAAIVAAVPAIAVASTSSSSAPASSSSQHLFSQINCQELAWRTSPVSTSSSSYANVPGLKGIVISAGGMIVNVSVVLNGGPVALRLTDTSVAGTLTVPPGHVNFNPATGRTSLSFTWTDPGISAAARGHAIHLQWRKTSTSAVTLRRGDITVGFMAEPGTCASGG